MFFERCEVFKNNGKAYDVSEAANVSHFNCKMLLMIIWKDSLDHKKFESLQADSYADFREELIGKLKEFDQFYINHEMTAHKELGAIQAESFIPLTDLWEATNDYHKMFTDGQMHAPTEDKFAQRLSKICEIFATFRQKSELKENSFNI